MKRSQRLLMAAGFVAITAIVIGLTVVLSNKFLHQEKSVDAPAQCQTVGKTHPVAIKDGTVQPSNIDARLCDQLSIQNLGTQTRLIGFGNHARHVAYNGVTERLLKQGQTLTLVLNQAGTYHFHDHYQPSLEVDFVVRP
jgi:hypothetical protein